MEVVFFGNSLILVDDVDLRILRGSGNRIGIDKWNFDCGDFLCVRGDFGNENVIVN